MKTVYTVMFFLTVPCCVFLSFKLLVIPGVCVCLCARVCVCCSLFSVEDNLVRGAQASCSIHLLVLQGRINSAGLPDGGNGG